MRRYVLIGLPLLLLAGCNSYVGSPYDGFGGFIGDTINPKVNPNRPVGAADNMRRVSGEVVDTEPLLPEPGNIWPGPLPPARSLSDLSRMPPGDPSLPPMDQQPSYAPPRQPRGSSTPPGPAPGPAPGGVPMSRGIPPAAAPPGALPPIQGNTLGRTLQTPNGAASTTIGGNGVETFSQPGGRNGVVINNGNGTSTLIGTDGTTTTVPSPR